MGNHCFKMIMTTKQIKEILNNIFLKLLGLQKEVEKLRLEEMARKICKEQGLNQQQENELIATIWAESGFDPKAINKNRDGSLDIGLCQFNSYWYIFKGLITREDALNPETAVRVMARRWKKGYARDWYGYRDGKYLAFMPKKVV